MNKRAKVIAFSGIDGCGKSTQIQFVNKCLSQEADVFIAKLAYFPLNDMGNNKIKDMLLKCRSGLEIIKYYSSLKHDVYNKYDFVLCDRHFLCYLAYAYAYGVKRVDIIKNFLDLIDVPDLTLYFDIDVVNSLDRINMRGGAVDKNENEEILRKAKEGYELLIPQFDNVKRVNANEEIEKIENSISKILVKQKYITSGSIIKNEM